MTEANRNLVLRVLSALILAPPIVYVVISEQVVGLAVVVHIAALLALGEFVWVSAKTSPLWLRIVTILAGTSLCALVTLWPKTDLLFGALLLIGMIIITSHLFAFRDITTVSAEIGLSFFALLYIPLPLATLTLIKQTPLGTQGLILALTLTWFSDTGAYFVGRAFGKRKLYPKVSPGKTVAGAVGGIGGGLCATLLAKYGYLPSLTLPAMILLGVVGSIAAQIGDLAESLLKRSFGIKDSSRLIPGHGGLLDRIDALLFVAPVIYFYLVYLHP